MTDLHSVRATLNYSEDNGKPPDYYFYEPDPSVKLNPPGTDAHEVTIHDAWPLRHDIRLDKEGFELHDFDPSFKDFADEAKVKQAFYQQVVDFVKAHTGAKRVEVFDHTIRQRLPADLKQQTEVQGPPSCWFTAITRSRVGRKEFMTSCPMTPRSCYKVGSLFTTCGSHCTSGLRSCHWPCAMHRHTAKEICCAWSSSTLTERVKFTSCGIRPNTVGCSFH